MKSGGICPLFACAGVLAAFMGGARVSSAAPLFSFGSNMAPALVYTPGAWNINDHPMTAISAVTTTFSFYSQPSNITMSWTAPLITDNSGISPNAPGQADATFGVGSTLTLTGNWQGEVTNTVLLTATVTGFRVRESNASSNILRIVGDARIMPTGGYFRSGASPTISMPDPAYTLGMQFSGSLSLDGGGPTSVNNFAENIFLTGGVQWGIFQIPEPGTALLAISGAVLLISRKRRRIG